MSTEPLMSSDDDSDVDPVTDFLDPLTANVDSQIASVKNYIEPIEDLMSGFDNKNHNSGNNDIGIIVCDVGENLSGQLSNIRTNTSSSSNTNNNISNNNHHNNMVPIISVTPHSPGTKYNNILDDSLSILQCIRESVVQMKNSSQGLIYGPSNNNLTSSKIFSSCSSLPDLGNPAWPVHSIHITSHDRRRSCTAIEDPESTKNSHKSVSLSSLDSEEQESIRAHRANRNSTGGISTHSLNEAELARDFEKIAKWNLVPAECRIPLKKSTSIPSIVPIYNQNAKEENNAVPEVYTDHPEKRRKRGSLFFRKKKDKTKSKGQSTICDVCGAVINLSVFKEHSIECKSKVAKGQKSNSVNCKKHSTNSSHHDHEEHNRDFYDGAQNEHSNYADDAPLIKNEFLNEPPIGPQDLDADPVLGIVNDEPDSWSPSVPREIVKSLKDKQVKRQEHIYEFIMTEKHHCQTLLVMQKVFVESLQRHFSRLNLERMFPRLLDLTELHTGFLKKLRLKQREHPIVDSIADILLDFFSSMSAQKLKNAYGEFCSNHRSALNTFKCYMTEDQMFAEWYKHCQQNPLLKKKGIPECILFVTQRLTKYPLLIQPLLKSSLDDKIEHEKLQKSLSLVKDILVEVDASVANKEKEDRQLEIFKKIDAKSYAIFKKNKFKKSDIISSNRKLKFEGVATLMQGRSKMLTVLVVVLSDCLFFLQENSHKYSFFTPENKVGVVSLQKLLIREKAGTESRSIYIISSNPANPEMYELKVQNPKDKNIWINSIRAAVLDCPSDDSENEEYMTADQKQKLIDAKQEKIREIICKIRNIDFQQAMLLEEKISLQLSILLGNQNSNASTDQLSVGADTFLLHFGSYKDLVNDDCDAIEIWKRVLLTVQDISQLASSLYEAATGLPLSRSYSSVCERQNDMFVSPTLPKRAETFGGFDERRNKPYLLSRDVVLSTLSPGYFSNRDGDKRDSKGSDIDSISVNASTSFCNTPSNSTKTSTDQLNNDDLLKDSNYAALQISNNLQTLLCIISQQMTTIQSLQHQLSIYRENPKSVYRHNDQLEELRNLQDRFQEEKTTWLKQVEHKEKEMEKERKELKALQEQTQKDQKDIQEQREQLYRKMEVLSSQGLLISPNVAFPVNPGNLSQQQQQYQEETYSTSQDEHQTDGNSSSLINRSKDRWKTMNAPKTPPVNLVSATNAQKVNPSAIKQQLPLKLSSLSSTKILSPSTTAISNSSGVSQVLPLKLSSSNFHIRTGSSPAVIQQLPSTQSGNPATRTNTYPKLPERYRLRSSDGVSSTSDSSNSLSQEASTPKSSHHQRNSPVHGNTIKSASANQMSTVPSNENNNKGNKEKEEEIIYF